MSQHEFRYRLTAKSSLATIAKAVRALGMEMKIEKQSISFSWDTDSTVAGKTIYNNKFMLDEKVPEWLNERLEAEGLLKGGEE